MDLSDTASAQANLKDARARDVADAIMALIRDIHGGLEKQIDAAHAKLVRALRDMQ
jgi:hypothetical protein